MRAATRGDFASPLLSAGASAFAATTATWELNGYQDFLRGRMSGLSITRDGRLILGPKLDTVFPPIRPRSGASPPRPTDRSTSAPATAAA